MQLMDLGIKDVIRRSYGSSLELTAALLRALGEPEDRVERDLRRFRKHDHETLLRQFAVYRDEQKLIQSSLESAQELQQLFESDVEQAAADPGR
jgi:hypothetical protein